MVFHSFSVAQSSNLLNQARSGIIMLQGLREADTTHPGFLHQCKTRNSNKATTSKTIKDTRGHTYNLTWQWGPIIWIYITGCRIQKVGVCQFMLLHECKIKYIDCWQIGVSAVLLNPKQHPLEHAEGLIKTFRQMNKSGSWSVSTLP